MIERKEIVKSRYNKWPKDYDKTLRGRLAGFRAMYKQASKILEKNYFNSEKIEGKKLLDIGCGTGVFLRKLASKYPNSYFCGIDTAEEMIKNANEQNNFKNLEFRVGDVSNLEFQDNEFNHITSLISLHYWEHDKAVSEIRRVLKPQGKILIADHKIAISGKGYEKIFSKKELKELFENHGFINVKHYYPSPSRFYGLIPTVLGAGMIASHYAFQIPTVDYVGIPFFVAGVASLFPLLHNQMITAEVRK